MTRLYERLPVAKWAVWNQLPRRERVLQVMAYVCDVLKPRERRGNNRGDLIDAMTDDAGYERGLPWCAIAISACMLASGYKKSDLPPGWGAVRNWAGWAKETERHSPKPKRGYLAYWLNADKTGHIGIVVRAWGLWVQTIEGNTTPDAAGNQRDGDGMYRKTRLITTWTKRGGFLELPQ